MTRPKKPPTLPKLLNSAANTYYKAIERFAHQARVEVVKPFCDLHNLEFISGQSGWTFRATYGHIWFDDTTKDLELDRSHFGALGDEDNVQANKLPDHMPHDLRDVLYAETLAGYLGNYMDDYTPDTFQRNKPTPNT